LPAPEALPFQPNASALQNKVGTLKPGMTADFVAVDRDPLADINALQEIVLVVHDGDIVVNRLSP
jgi:imidazolonepropionase-like amidohydrolase